MKEYTRIANEDIKPSKGKSADFSALHMFVLKQVAASNMPSTWDDWVTVKVEGRKGTEVEFFVSPHGLRVGTSSDWIEVPLDGPHAMAAAELKGCTLPTLWMAQEIYRQAKEDGSLVNFFANCQLANALGDMDCDPDRPDGKKMKSPEWIQKRSELVKQWMEEHKISNGQLTSCSFKEIVQPVAGLTTRQAQKLRIGGFGITLRKGKSKRLEIWGGCLVNDKGEPRPVIQGTSAGAHWEPYFDYSHLARFVKPEIRVDGEVKTLDEFFNNAEYAREFGFQKSSVPERAYQYSDELAKFVEENK
jgi:hypothetical protein